MTITPATVFRLLCDGCGLPPDADGEPIFNSAEEAEGWARDYDWIEARVVGPGGVREKRLYCSEECVPDGALTDPEEDELTGELDFEPGGEG